MRKYILFILLILICSKSYATTYYVRPDGDDTNCDGSADGVYDGVGGPDACSFETPQHCADTVASPNDKCIFADGTYPVGFHYDNGPEGSVDASKSIVSITKSNPPVVTVVSHGYSNGDIVYIDSAQGMIQFNYKMYTIQNVTTDTFELVGENSTNYDEYIGSGTAAKASPIQFVAQNRGGAIFDVSVVVSGWSNSGEAANTYHSSSVGFSTTNSAARLWRLPDTTMLLQTSTIGAVDSEGEFFYDSGNDRFVIYTTSDPNTKTYKAWDSADQEDAPAILIRKTQWILVDGIYTQYSQGGIQVGDSTNTGSDYTKYVTVRYTSSTYSAGTGSVSIQTSPNNNSYAISFDHIIAAYSDDTALTGGIQNNGHCIKCGSNFNGSDGRYATISNSVIHDCRWHGIQMSNGYTDGYFYNNTIYNYSLKGTGSGTGIRIGRIDSTASRTTKNAKIFDNSIGGGASASGYSIGTSIYLQEDASNVDIYRNTIHDNDWHGIYIFSTVSGLNPFQIRIYNNHFYRNKVSGVRSEQSDSVEIYNNSFYECGSTNAGSTYAALSLNDGTGPDKASGVVFKNNAVKNLAARTIGALSGTNLTSDYNDLYTEGSTLLTVNGQNYTSLSAYRQTTYNDLHSVTSDPLYTNAPTDLTTLSASPTRGAGTSLTSLGYFTNDYSQTERRNIWDIGAYEQSAETTVTGLRIGN